MVLETGLLGDRYALVPEAWRIRVVPDNIWNEIRNAKMARCIEVKCSAAEQCFDVNDAVVPEERKAVLNDAEACAPEESVRVFLHSLAFGSA